MSAATAAMAPWSPRRQMAYRDGPRPAKYSAWSAAPYSFRRLLRELLAREKAQYLVEEVTSGSGLDPEERPVDEDAQHRGLGPGDRECRLPGDPAGERAQGAQRMLLVGGEARIGALDAARSRWSSALARTRAARQPTGDLRHRQAPHPPAASSIASGEPPTARQISPIRA